MTKKCPSVIDPAVNARAVTEAMDDSAAAVNDNDVKCRIVLGICRLVKLSLLSFRIHVSVIGSDLVAVKFRHAVFVVSPKAGVGDRNAHDAALADLFGSKIVQMPMKMRKEFCPGSVLLVFVQQSAQGIHVAPV